jgi:sterol 3beta-glucosyltransferase
LLTHPDIHEGAEFPVVGAIAAAAYFFSTVGTNASDFSARLKRKPAPVQQQLLAETGYEAEKRDSQSESISRLSSVQLEKLATRMAHKIYAADGNDNLNKAPVLHGPARLHALRANKKTERGRAHQIASATAHFAVDLTKTGLKSKFFVCCRVAFGVGRIKTKIMSANDEQRP